MQMNKFVSIFKKSLDEKSTNHTHLSGLFPLQLGQILARQPQHSAVETAHRHAATAAALLFLSLRRRRRLVIRRPALVYQLGLVLLGGLLRVQTLLLPLGL